MTGTGHDALRLQDRETIRDALRRFVRGIDRKDWVLARSAFHDDAWDHHGPYDGDIEGFFRMTIARHVPIIQSLHQIGDAIIEFFGPLAALVETPFVVYQIAAPAGEPGVLKYDTIGRYVDRFRDDGGDWRIVKRTVVIEQFRLSPAAGPDPVPPGWAVARRDGSDAIEVERLAMRSAAG